MSGEAFLAILAEVGKFERLAVFGGKNFGGPQCFIKTLDAAVESVLTVVLGEGVGFAVEHELRMRYTVSVAANERAEVALVVHVAVGGVITEDDVGELAVAVRHLEGDDGSAIVGDAGFRAALIREHIKIDCLAAGSFAEGFFRGGTGLRCCANGRQSGHKQRSREDCEQQNSFHAKPPPERLSKCSTPKLR